MLLALEGTGVSDSAGSTWLSLPLSLHAFLSTPFPKRNEAILLQEGQLLASRPCSLSPAHLALLSQLAHPGYGLVAFSFLSQAAGRSESAGLELAVGLGIAHRSLFTHCGSHG